MENVKNGHNAFFGREELKKDLKRKSVQGAVIRVIFNGTSAALTIGSAIVLARLLTPEEFGLFAMVVAITEFARLIMELGLGTATVQREEITHEEVSALFSINLGIGIILMAAIAGLSPAVAWFYGDTRLFDICMVLSTVFLFRGLTVQHRSLLERQMRFGYLGVIYVTSTLLSICVAIALALHGFGVWALVWREIVSATLYAAGTWLFCGWIPGLPRRNSGVRSSLRFGADVSGFNIVQYFAQNLDRMLIGRFCGATPLGLYAKAFQLAMMPIEHIRMTFWDVGLSPLSALHGDAERYRRFYSRLLSVLSFLYMPLVVFLAIQSEDVIRLLLGEAWISAAPLFRIFAIAGFVRPIVGTFQLILISCGKTRSYLLWGMMNGVCMIMAYAVGIRWGAVGVAYAYAFASYAFLVWSLWYCFKDTPVSALLVIKTILLPVMSSCGAGITLIAVLPHISNASMLVSIIISILVIAVAYLGIWLCIPTGRQKLSEFWSYRAELFSRA